MPGYPGREANERTGCLEILDGLIQENGGSEFIRSDNESEFINHELKNRLYDYGLKPVYIELGSPL
jgi:hypothetical protein